MITGVQDVYYNVGDMNRAIAFYTKGLGLKVKTDNEWWTALDCGGITVGLHWSEDGVVPTIPRDDHGTHAGGTLTFRSNDIASDRANIERFGGKILGETQQPWGHMLVFEDPDGNVLKLMNPK